MIEVQIAEYAASKHGHDTLVGAALMQALREAGIPVVRTSVFVLLGVERGKLTFWTEDDLDGRVYFFRWQEDENDRKTAAPSIGMKLSAGHARKYGRHAVVIDEDDEL